MSKLEELFDVAPVPVEVISQGASVMVPPEGAEDEDHQYARGSTYNLIEKGSEAVDIAMRILRESESPKAVEVLAMLLKNMSEINKSLVVLNKDKNEARLSKTSKAQNTPQVGQAVNTQNNIYVGSSKDLNKIIQETMSKGPLA